MRRTGTGRRLVAWLAVAALCGGCSGLAPHIFSDRVLLQPGADGKPQAPASSFDDYYGDATLVLRRYVTAARDDGNAVPMLSAGLIALTAATLYKGITGAHPNDMAAAGVVGSSAVIYGSTFTSRPRRDVYRHGAEAMACALAAVEPLRKGQAYLGRPSDGTAADTLYGRIARVQAERAALVALRDANTGLRQSAYQVEERTEQTCVDVKPAACPAIPAAATADERARLEAACKRRQATFKSCKTEKRSIRTVNAAIVSAFDVADTEIAQAEAQVKEARRGIDALEQAGPSLGYKSLQIQLTVSNEVEKTVPDLKAVLAAGQNMRGIAFGMTGLQSFKSSELGSAQGGAATARLQDAQRQSLRQVEQATSRLREARLALEDLVSGSLGAGYADVRKTLNECSVRASGVKLVISPSGDTVSVPEGGTATFFVSGGTGFPTAIVVSGNRQGALPWRGEGGLSRFDYKAEGVVAGDTVMVRFADGAGQGEQTVAIKVVAAAAAAGGTPAVAAEPGGADKGNLTLLPPETRAALGAKTTANADELLAAVKRCQKAGGLPETGKFDAATKKLAEAGACKAA